MADAKQYNREKIRDYRWTARSGRYEYPIADGHLAVEIIGPAVVSIRCSCGWIAAQSRRQNALARAAKLKAAIRQHRAAIAKATAP